MTATKTPAISEWKGNVQTERGENGPCKDELMLYVRRVIFDTVTGRQKFPKKRLGINSELPDPKAPEPADHASLTEKWTDIAHRSMQRLRTILRSPRPCARSIQLVLNGVGDGTPAGQHAE